MKHSFSRALKLSAFLAVASLPAVTLLPGCGGGGNSSGPTVVQQAGGQVSLGNGQVGNLGFARFSNGTAFGTFVIADGTGPVTGTPFPVGSYDVSGTVNGTSLKLVGTIPSGPVITANVTLPTGTTAGSYTVTINGQSFTGPVVNSTPTPVPTATTTPVPTVTPIPTNTPVPTNTPIGN